MTEQKERLKKLYALALRGVGGEKEQAQAILDKLLKKYMVKGLSDEQPLKQLMDGAANK